MRSDALALRRQCKQDVAGADARVPHLTAHAERHLDDAFDSRGRNDGTSQLLPLAPEPPIDRSSCIFFGDLERSQNPGRLKLLVGKAREQQVLGGDVWKSRFFRLRL